jgi:hypothetical protein
MIEKLLTVFSLFLLLTLPFNISYGVINIENSSEWVIAHNGKDFITRPIKLESNNQLTTGQPYIERAETLPELLAKVYVDPQPYEGEEEFELVEGYHIESLEIRPDFYDFGGSE